MNPFRDTAPLLGVAAIVVLLVVMPGWTGFGLLAIAIVLAARACSVLAADLRDAFEVPMGDAGAYSGAWMIAAVLAGTGATLLASGRWWLLPAVGLPFYFASLLLRPWIVRANLGRDLPAPKPSGFAALERAATALKEEKASPRFEIVEHRRDDDTPQGSDTDYEWHVRSTQTGDAIASFSGYWYEYTGRKGGTQGVRLTPEGDAVAARDYEGNEQCIELPSDVRLGKDGSEIVLTYRDGRTETRARNRVVLVLRSGQVSRLPLVGDPRPAR